MLLLRGYDYREGGWSGARWKRREPRDQRSARDAGRMADTICRTEVGGALQDPGDHGVERMLDDLTAGGFSVSQLPPIIPSQ